MSIFSELLSKISEISNSYTQRFNEDFEEALRCLDKFEEEVQNGKRARDKLQKKNAMTTLQSIHEDDGDPTKATEKDNKSENNSTENEKRGSKKRSKGEVDDMFSPEQEKRQKRNASVKAQSVISKQVNVNLNQKLRREDDNAKTKGRRAKDDNKENTEPLLIQVKQEKISLPPEPMDMESLSLNINIKQEVDKDGFAMPPPTAPVPKLRKGATKEKQEEQSDDETTGRKRSTRTRKQTDTSAPPTRQSSRSTRASSRASCRAVKATEQEEPVVAEARPKRTRAKRAVAEASTTDNDKETSPQENIAVSPAEKPRPKRTRKGQKAIEKQVEKPVETELVQLKQEVASKETTPVTSPVLPAKKTAKRNENGKIAIDHTQIVGDTLDTTQIITHTMNTTVTISNHLDSTVVLPNEVHNHAPVTPRAVAEIDLVGDTLDATKIITHNMDTTATISNHLDATVVLPNAVYNHAPVTPKAVPQTNGPVVLGNNCESVLEEKPQKAIMDATVVIEKDAKAPNVTEDSLLTDDDSIQGQTPPKEPPKPQPLSAVKEKVQKFEEMATRQTRTKTRAMAKKEEPTENQTPPDKVSKAILSAETLSKMNSMIFNGKQPHISSSTSKLRDTNTKQLKSYIPSSTSKLSVNRTKDSVEEQRREKEDARRKKEALLEAKKEMQRRKREEKMAAAAAARSAAERERRAQQQAAARERREKQAHADDCRLERLREVEKKKLEQARKVAETEERRRAEEAARQHRADELRRADDARRRQLHEAEALKKEAALMDKEIERRQREFLEKQKLKQKMDGNKILTPLKTPGTPGGVPLPPIEPVYMADGFEYLNSDEEQENEDRPIPAWSTSKVWKQKLQVQTKIPAAHVDRLFSVREHTPDLREIFPGIERSRLKRTSSAVWRTPPARLPALAE